MKIISCNLLSYNLAFMQHQKLTPMYIILKNLQIHVNTAKTVELAPFRFYTLFNSDIFIIQIVA